MLTIQTFKLIKNLKLMENPVIHSKNKNLNSMLITSSKNRFLNCNKEIIHYDLKDENSYLKIKIDELDYLVENDYIYIDKNYIFIKHKGYHLFQIRIMKFFQFLYRSILTPITVSIITTFIYNRYLK